MDVKIQNIKLLINNLIAETSKADTYYSNGESRLSGSSLYLKYKNIMSICEDILEEHYDFVSHSAGLKDKREILNSLEYVLLLLDLEEKETQDKKEFERNFLDSALDKLRQAGISFENQDYSGVSNKLNTSVELALKDALDIPSTIKGINTSKIIDILIKYKVGPVEYLKEVQKHVLMDNLVKHQGMSPVESRAITAISSVTNLFNKLKEPLTINEEIRDKIWSDDK